MKREKTVLAVALTVMAIVLICALRNAQSTLEGAVVILVAVVDVLAADRLLHE